MTSTPPGAAHRSGARNSSTRPAVVPTGVRWLALLVTFALTACSSVAPPFDAQAVAREWAAFMQRDYILRPGDKLAVRVDQLGGGGEGEGANVLQEVLVSPTGTIDLRRLKAPLHVAGKSVGACRTLIVDAYKEEFTSDPLVSVSLMEASAQSVYVCGEVMRPGVVPYVPGLTMVQAMSVAGGFDITICWTDIRVLRIGPDGSNRTFRVNLDAVILEEAPDFLLLPGDIVYAQTSPIADAGDWVELWIRRLLPFGLGGPSVTTIYTQ